MAITLRSSAQNAYEGSSGGSFSVAKPSGLANGDLLIAIEWLDEESTFANPSQSWDVTNASPGAFPATHPHGRVHLKRVTNAGSEPANYGFPLASYGNKCAQVIALAGVPNSAEVAIAWNYGNFGSSPYTMTAPDAPYSGSDPAIIVGFCPIVNDVTPTITPPSGFTELGSEMVAPTYAWIVAGHSYLITTGTPAAGPRTGTTSTRDSGYPHWSAVTVALPGTVSSPPSGPESGRFFIAYI